VIGSIRRIRRPQALIEAGPPGLQFSKGFTSAHYKKELDFIAVRFGGPVAIEDLARVAGMSPAHFLRLFEEVLGDSPYQFVMDYRVEQAKKMLKDPHRPPIDIALSCGFSDQPHFSRVFKQLTGLTPKAFREEAEHARRVSQPWTTRLEPLFTGGRTNSCARPAGVRALVPRRLNSHCSATVFFGAALALHHRRRR
jgi:AraC-like DNA-binding protein